MTKKKFLKLLEEKLKILNEKELKDIIDEYSNIIDEKVSAGKTEEEAVSDFDDVDTLVNEILDAYKINPNYEKEAQSDTKKIMNDIEESLSKTAKDLSNGTKKLYTNFKNKNGEFNIDMLFEIIIKVILLLFGLILLRVPFEIISSLGESLFDVFMYPVDKILGVTWNVIVGLVYFACVILIIISVFKKYFKIEDVENVDVKENIEDSKKKEKLKVKKVNKEVKKEKNSTFTIIVRILLTFIFLFPIWCINFSIVIAIAAIIYLLIKGVELWGILVLLIGLSLLFGFIADIVNKLIYQKERLYFFPLIISAIFITIGGLMTVETGLTYNFSDKLDGSNFSKETIYRENITENTIIDTKKYLKSIVIDDSLEDGEVVIKINYYDIYRIDKNSFSGKIDLSFDYTKNKKNVYDLIIKDLKDKNVYNYEDLDEINITIYVNTLTRNLIS